MNDQPNRVLQPPLPAIEVPDSARCWQYAGGRKRFKIRAEALPQHYILAVDEAAARAFYRERYTAAAGAELLVIELPD